MTRRLDVRGVQLAVAEAGAGLPKHLLLMHGFAGAKEDFSEWLEPLADAGWHAVTFDQRGHGQSAHPKGEEHYSLEVLTDDVQAVVDELQWDRFVLLGHSMGGMVAQRYAIGSPERLAALILMGTSHTRPDGIDEGLVSLGHQIVRAGGMAALLEAQKHLDQDPLDPEAHRRLLATRPDYAEFCDRKTLAASEDMWLALSAEIVRQPDRLPALKALSLPALVIVGGSDEIFLEQSTALARAIPDAVLAVIGHAGHSPQFERPEEWWAVLSAFLGGL
ncbi:MAG: alpha/beta hydrolase [Actinomycetota bacterium]|nr:alpha/beta hydrolase [Actinomycetota bacterium]